VLIDAVSGVVQDSVVHGERGGVVDKDAVASILRDNVAAEDAPVSLNSPDPGASVVDGYALRDSRALVEQEDACSVLGDCQVVQHRMSAAGPSVKGGHSVPKTDDKAVRHARVSDHDNSRARAVAADRATT